MIDYKITFGPEQPNPIPEFLRRLSGNAISGAAVPPGSPLPSRKSGVVSKPEAPGDQAPVDRAPVPSYEEQQQIKKANALKKLRDRTAARAALAEGKMWRDGRFVHPNSMSRAKYNRILRELPTPSMKRLFVHLYSERVL